MILEAGKARAQTSASARRAASTARATARRCHPSLRPGPRRGPSMSGLTAVDAILLSTADSADCGDFLASASCANRGWLGVSPRSDPSRPCPFRSFPGLRGDRGRKRKSPGAACIAIYRHQLARRVGRRPSVRLTDGLSSDIGDWRSWVDHHVDRDAGRYAQGHTSLLCASPINFWMFNPLPFLIAMTGDACRAEGSIQLYLVTHSLETGQRKQFKAILFNEFIFTSC